MLSIDNFKSKLVLLWKKGAFHIILGNFFTKFVVFFGSIFLVRTLSKSSYGMLGIIENIYGYIYLFAGMGLANAILRYVLRAETPNKEFGYFKYVLKKGSIINLFLVIVIGLICLFYPFSEEFVSIRWLLIITLFSLPFQFLIDSNLFTYRAKFANKRFAITAFIISTILVYSKFLAALLWDLNGVVSANVIVNVSLGVILSILTYKTFFKGYYPIVLQKHEKKTVDNYSIQYMLTNGIWAIFMLNDIFLLSLFGSDPTVIADYKVAYVLPGNLAIISGAIGIFVAPYFVKHELDHLWVRKNYIKVLGITTLLLGTVVVFLFVFAKPLVTLLYGQQYENVVNVMRLLLIAAFINSGLRYTTANLLAAMGQIKYNMIVSIIGVLLQIIINFLMIPHYGAVGVAWTSIIVYTIMAIVLFVVFVKKYNLLQR